MEFSATTTRPRNVDWKRAAAILYGDWGTSKAYVIGLAFAVAGYSSPWLIGAMCVLTALVAVNYIAICRYYPNGGGVYATVRHRSEIISIVGAFLLVADYVVTAAVSALSAFLYLGVAHPQYWACGAILFIGCLNFSGRSIRVVWLCWFPFRRRSWWCCLASWPFLISARRSTPPGP